ncbi:hypothetical protein MAMC_00614 [Methylacidimicrobium cyclopophantes]|uniref:Uncharacterized protein n=1 Tax=Methylacidimicrobium cyclopophantes TaxID=1041766 RepID=A0A5E6MJ11_9BACT|nr:hypothetical protein [Methylacidimicrobium cyclopophantes]VVM05482.1 hypothetical protein MAMC_00614 [Methylacidimicrobium cyclopophantes]
MKRLRSLVLPRSTTLLLCLWIGGEAILLPAATLPDAIDRDPVLAQTGWKDRALKWLIASGNSRDFLRADWLDTILLRFLQREGGAALVQRDLLRGDGLLADALTQAFEILRVGSRTAREQVEELAREGHCSLWTSFSANLRALSAIRDYLLTTPSDYPAALFALEAWKHDDRDAFPGSVMETAMRCLLLPPKKPEGLEATWETGKRLGSLTGEGGGALLLLTTFPKKEATFYDTVWEIAWQNLVEDPPLLKEYLERLLVASTSRYWLVRTLQSSLGSMEGDNFVRHYFAIDFLHPTPIGRPKWLWEALVGARAGGGLLPLAKKKLSSLLLTDERYADFLLWHLTRPAEAAAQATREALIQALRQEEEIVRKALETVWEGQIGLATQLEESSWWSLCGATRGKSAADIRRSCSRGELDRTSLLSIGGVLASFFERDDSAWSSLFMNGDEGTAQSFPFLASVFPTLVQIIPECALAWNDTLLHNDQEAFVSFGRWIASRPQSRVTVREYAAWLQRAGDQMRQALGKENPVMGEEAQVFVESFSQWASGTGWEFILHRLQREVGVAQEIRRLFLVTWRANPEEFWRGYGGLAFLPGAKSACQRAADTLVAYGGPEDALRSIAAWDYAVGDACGRVWDVLWESVPDRNRLVQAVLHSDGLSDLNSVLVTATKNVLERPEARSLAEKVARSLGKSIDLLRILAEDPTATREILIRCLTDPSFRESWERSVFLVAKFGDQSPIIAQWILSRKEALDGWNHAFTVTLRDNPLFLRAVVKRMAHAKAGELTWTSEMRKLEQAIMTAILTDRLLWENLIEDKTGGISTYARKNISIP